MMYFLSLLLPLATAARTIPLENVTPAEFRSITREFSANSLFTTVTGAAGPGGPFSFELGVVGGYTNTPGIDDAAHDAEVPRLPNAFGFATLALPLALTAEVGWLPPVGGREYRANVGGFGLKWTPTDLFFASPVDVAVRAQVARTQLKFEATVNGGRANISYAGRATALELRASKNLGILTPFVGCGLVDTHADMNATGSSVFDPLLVANQKATARPSGSLFNAGLEVHLLIAHFGLEYQRALATDRFTAKVSVGF